MRVGGHRLVLTSWRRVLETLERSAAAGGYAGILEDVAQLRGLTERMNSDIIPPIRGDELTDVCVARRMLNYAGLIDDVTERLVKEGVAETRGLRPSAWGRYLRLHGRFGLWLGVDLLAWRAIGVTPIWSAHNTNSSFSGIKGEIRQAAKLFDDAREADGQLGIPIRLKTGVERDRVVDDAVGQMHSIADRLGDAFPDG